MRATAAESGDLPRNGQAASLRGISPGHLSGSTAKRAKRAKGRSKQMVSFADFARFAVDLKR
jgi:hypothetical protein